MADVLSAVVNICPQTMQIPVLHPKSRELFSPDKSGGNICATGAGFFIDSRGYIITSNHVLKNSEAVLVELADGTVYSAFKVGADPNIDLAVLKIDLTDITKHSGIFSVLEPAGEAELVAGAAVYSAGSPLGYKFSVFKGIISHGRRFFHFPGFSIPFIQTDVSPLPGSSGGPLFTDGGKLAGVMTAFHKKSDKLGFALHPHLALASAYDIINGQPTPRFTGYFFKQSGKKIYVSKSFVYQQVDLQKGSALMNGDIIIKAGGTAVTSLTGLEYMLKTVSGSGCMDIEYIQNLVPRTGELCIYPTPVGFAKTFFKNRFDIEIVNINEAEPESNCPHGGFCFVVNSSKSGCILKGDVVVEVNEIPLKSASHTDMLIAGAMYGNVKLKLFRKDVMKSCIMMQ